VQRDKTNATTGQVVIIATCQHTKHNNGGKVSPENGYSAMIHRTQTRMLDECLMNDRSGRETPILSGTDMSASSIALKTFLP